MYVCIDLQYRCCVLFVMPVYLLKHVPIDLAIYLYLPMYLSS